MTDNLNLVDFDFMFFSLMKGMGVTGACPPYYLFTLPRTGLAIIFLPDR